MKYFSEEIIGPENCWYCLTHQNRKQSIETYIRLDNLNRHKFFGHPGKREGVRDKDCKYAKCNECGAGSIRKLNDLQITLFDSQAESVDKEIP